MLPQFVCFAVQLTAYAFLTALADDRLVQTWSLPDIAAAHAAAAGSAGLGPFPWPRILMLLRTCGTPTAAMDVSHPMLIIAAATLHCDARRPRCHNAAC